MDSNVTASLLLPYLRANRAKWKIFSLNECSRAARSQRLGPYFRCDRALCSRKNAVMAVSRDSLTVVAGTELIATYAANTHDAQHYFCEICGVCSHHAMRGEKTSVLLTMAYRKDIGVYGIGEAAVGDGKSDEAPCLILGDLEERDCVDTCCAVHAEAGLSANHVISTGRCTGWALYKISGKISLWG